MTARARDLLLRLVAGPGDDIAARAAALEAEDWAWLRTTARQYRLEPLLLHRCADAQFAATVPAAVRSDWVAAERHWAMTSLAQRMALQALTAAIEARGIAPVALKGAWLAFCAYPRPALRPMHDLDILVAEDGLDAAHAALLAAGFKHPPNSKKLEEALAENHHIPPLIAPTGPGIVVELHHRIDSGERAGGVLAPAKLLARRIAVQTGGRPIPYPCVEDNLVHLIAHSAIQHRFNNGPLILSDVVYLARAHPVDWPAFWRAAEASGLARSAALVFALARRYGGADALPPFEAAPPVAEAHLDLAAERMTQPPERAWQRNVASDLGSSRRPLVAFIRRMRPKRHVLAAHSNRDADDVRVLLSYPGWLVHRGRGFIAALFDARDRQAARGDRALDAWLRGKA